MADLEKDFPFHQAKAWEPQDALHNPIPSATRGFRLPETIKINRVVAKGEQRVWAEVVPDQAVHGIEWPMHHAIPQFIRKVVDAWEVKTSAKDGIIVFSYWANCVTGKTDTFWNAVVNEHHKDDIPKTYKSWMQCVGL